MFCKRKHSVTLPVAIAAPPPPLENGPLNRISRAPIRSHAAPDDIENYQRNSGSTTSSEIGDRQTDSTTCSKESFRIVLSIISSKQWRCKMMDVKTS